VEYKDPAEEEWETFQKVMQVESQVATIHCHLEQYLDQNETFKLLLLLLLFFGTCEALLDIIGSFGLSHF